jgi:hypothetical protein
MKTKPEMARQMIRLALKRTGGNRLKARILYKAKEYEIN